MNISLAEFSPPLFDRLTADPCDVLMESEPDHGGWRQSLQQDLSRLFNVRNGLSIEQFLGEMPNGVHYGLPDTLGLSARSLAHLACWEQVIARAIALYEPRLSHVSVKVTADATRPMSACIAITAAVALCRQTGPVHFQLIHDGCVATLVPVD